MHTILKSFETLADNFSFFRLFTFYFLEKRNVRYVCRLWLRIDWFNFLLGLADFEIDDAL